MLASIKCFWQLNQAKNNQELHVVSVQCTNKVDAIEVSIKKHDTFGVDGSLGYLDVPKLKKEVDFTATTDVEVAIKRFVDWFKNYYLKSDVAQ